MLTRTTSTGSYIPEIDGLRFFAISAVICCHISDGIGKGIGATSLDRLYAITSIGYFGVQLFFVISGFVLSLPFIKQFLYSGKRVSLRSYYLRRIARLEPPYVIALLASFFILVMCNKYSTSYLLPHLWSSMFYLHGAIYNSYSKVLFVAWSLEVEVQFYILMPLLAQVFRIKSEELRWFVLVSFVCLFSVLSTIRKDNLFLISYLQYFLSGFLLADVYCKLEWSGTRRVEKNIDARILRLTCDFICLISTALLGWMLMHRTESLAAPFLLFTSCLSGLKGQIVRWLLRTPLISALGSMCYTVYLYHVWIVWGIQSSFRRLQLGNDFSMNFLVQSIVLFPIIFLVSAILFWTIEKPFMDRAAKNLV